MDTIFRKRCNWSKNDALYMQYHDEEWGVPIYNDQKIFECLILEMFQSGLSWITILRKREQFRTAFDNFDYIKIANYSEKKLKSLQLNSGIIRNTSKIKAAKNNAIAFIEIKKEFLSFSKYIWDFVDGKPIHNNFINTYEIPAKTKLSDKISFDLKNRGFKYIGSTIIYAFMQSIGMVNDHTTNCFRHIEV